MSVTCDCCVLLGRGLCVGLIILPEESYRLWCVVVCDLETSSMRRPQMSLGRSTTGESGTETDRINYLRQFLIIYSSSTTSNTLQDIYQYLLAVQLHTSRQTSRFREKETFRTNKQEIAFSWSADYVDRHHKMRIPVTDSVCLLFFTSFPQKPTAKLKKIGKDYTLVTVDVLQGYMLLEYRTLSEKD